jgi:hypothetical protein
MKKNRKLPVKTSQFYFYNSNKIVSKNINLFWLSLIIKLLER